MERQIIFRDYMEQQAQDHLDLQDFARDSLDHIVLDAVTETRRYAGFGVTKTAQTEIQVAAGRFYDVLGAIYHRDTTLVQSMLTYLPAIAKRVVLVSVYGTETETDIEERDFLVDVDTGRTEPEAVATTSSRDAVLALTSGAESADPTNPATPVGHAPIAYVTLDPTSVVSVEMLTDFEVESTEDLDTRASSLETFKSQIEPRVSSLASDLAALANRVENFKINSNVDLSAVYQDLARLKANAELPQTYSDYGGDDFLSEIYSDTYDTGTLGYDCQISNSLTFAPANIDESELALFSANDPNAAYSNANGMLLPAYDSVVKLQTSATKASETSMSQYGYQTFEIVRKSYTAWRLRYGPYWRYWYPYPYWYYYTYGLYWWKGWPAYYPWIVAYYPYVWPYYYYYWWPYYWYEAYTVSYDVTETTNHSIEGAQIAQTFLVANDMWATKVGFYIAAKGAEENIFITLTETTNGMPDLNKAICHVSHPSTSIIVGGWNRVEIPPTFMARGSRYAVVITSNANHKVGMAAGESYIDGTFFYSTDGAYYLGDLTKDVMLEVWGAQFRAAQVTVELAPVNLDGGIRAIDITARGTLPESTQRIFEVRPSGAGDWIPLDKDHLDALTNAPPLFQLRVRFVGTKDMQPGLVLTGSRMNVSRPKTTFRHVSQEWTLGSPSGDITVSVKMSNFNETPHDCTLRLHSSAGYHDPDVTTTDLLDASSNLYKRTFHFSSISPEIDTFRTVIDGSTTNAANLFMVTEMLFWTNAA